jgi:hypothetical protein
VESFVLVRRIIIGFEVEQQRRPYIVVFVLREGYRQEEASSGADKSNFVLKFMVESEISCSLILHTNQ